MKNQSESPALSLPSVAVPSAHDDLILRRHSNKTKKGQLPMGTDLHSKGFAEHDEDPLETNARDSENANVFCAGSLGTFTYFKRNLLSLLELIKSDTIASRHVKEHILATSCVDESKPLVRETLNRTFSHFLLFPVVLRDCIRQGAEYLPLALPCSLIRPLMSMQSAPLGRDNGTLP